LTALSTQNDNKNFIFKTQRERKDLLNSFLDISIFDELYVLAKNEFFLQNKTFIFMGQMKFKYKIPKLIPISYSSNRHFFLFKPKLLGNYLLEVYKNGIHIDTLNIEVV
jgi:hypothetical protein